VAKSRKLFFNNDKLKNDYLCSDKQKTEFMHTSVKLNKYFMKNSKDSALVFCSLPTPTKSQSSADYLEYLDALCEGLPRVVLVKGSGMEVVTAYF
jgi:hypothetical protein